MDRLSLRSDARAENHGENSHSITLCTKGQLKELFITLGVTSNIYLLRNYISSRNHAVAELEILTVVIMQ